MKKLLTSLITLVFMGLFVSAQTAPNLIISEAYHALSPRYAYIEISNIGTDTADLSEVYISLLYNNRPYYHSRQLNPGLTIFLNDPSLEKRVPGDKLAPGQACLIINNTFILQTVGENIDTVTATPSFYFDKADIIMPYALERATHPMRGWNGDDAWVLLWDASGDGLVDVIEGVDEVLDVFDEYSYPELPVLDNAGTIVAFVRPSQVIGAYHRESLRRKTL